MKGRAPSRSSIVKTPKLIAKIVPVKVVGIIVTFVAFIFRLWLSDPQLPLVPDIAASTTASGARSRITSSIRNFGFQSWGTRSACTD